MEAKRPRAESNISASSIQIKDHEHCILCFNDLNFISLGRCDHKNVCNTCSLRLRLILEDEQCPICKTELDEILITKDKNMTWA
jgi:rubrerythrin